MATTREMNIAHVELSPPLARGRPSLATGERERWIDLAVTVENPSTKRMLVMSSVRQLHYDPATLRLRVGMHEPPSVKGRTRTHTSIVKLPNFVVVEPKSSLSFVVSIPQVIHFINPTTIGDQGPEVADVDISGVQEIELTIAFSDQPFESPPGLSADDLRYRLASWGRTVQRTMKAEMRGENDAALT